MGPNSISNFRFELECEPKLKILLEVIETRLHFTSKPEVPNAQ